ncbi:MAG: hypothetical protein GY799_31140 [Desulfobulbaceae bacterium]|nr:hypothetical protein [Desulfobulbaceae bacterium]
MDILDPILKLLGVLIAGIGGLWGLTKYIIERGLVPAAELDIECDFLGEKEDQNIIELTFYIINKGNSVLVVEKIRLKLKTLQSKDRLSLYNDTKKLGRLIFPHSVSKSLAPDEEKDSFLLVPHDTFVQPGVVQQYSFITTVDKSTEFLHAHAEFRYAQKPLAIQNAILKVSRKMGLIQYSLKHIYEPHTIQKGFNVTTS